MADNLIYDMDTTTDPSASDSDSSSRKPRQTPSRKEKESENSSKCNPDAKLNASVRTRVPLQENSYDEGSKVKHATYSGGENRSRRRPPLKSAPNKRWV